MGASYTGEELEKKSKEDARVGRNGKRVRLYDQRLSTLWGERAAAYANALAGSRYFFT
jgi:hypothetical protein